MIPQGIMQEMKNKRMNKLLAKKFNTKKSDFTLSLEEPLSWFLEEET